VVAGLRKSPVSQDGLRGAPAFGQPAIGQQRPKVPRVGLVGLGMPLAAPQRGGIGRLGQVRLQAGARPLLRDITPPGAPLDCERDLAPAGEPGQPGPHRFPVGGDDLAALDLPSRGVEIVEGDLLPVDIQPAYDGHRDLLTLPRASKRPHANLVTQPMLKRLSWGGPPRKSLSGKAIACRLKALTGPGADAWHLMIAGRLADVIARAAQDRDHLRGRRSLDLLAFEPRSRTPGNWQDWQSHSGARVARGGPGSMMYVPRGCPHAFANPGPGPARMIFLV